MKKGVLAINKTKRPGEDGYVRSFESVTAAARALNRHPCNVSRACNEVDGRVSCANHTIVPVTWFQE